MERNLEKLKSQLFPLYVGLRDDCNAHESLCPFLMQWGDKFPDAKNDGIIFYGRATNGWFGTWDYDVFFGNDNKDRGWNRDDQMVWAENQWLESDDGYVTSRSQFWSIVKGVSTRFYGDEWYNYVAWSNICKVAPEEKGNPNDTVFYNTLENNIKIFQAELNFWSPKYVVLLTDGLARDNENKIDWTSNYISSLNNGFVPSPIYEIAWDEENPALKIRVFELGERYVILSLHPQGRKVDLHKEAIIDIIEKIEQQERTGRIVDRNLQRQIKAWAEKYVPEFKRLAGMEEYKATYYTQSPLDVLTTSPELMLVGINPKDKIGHGGSLRSPQEYLKGNTLGDQNFWKNRFDADGKVASAWGKYVGSGRQFFGYFGDKTEDAIDNDEKTVWTNLIPFPSDDEKEILKYPELVRIGVESTLELIHILQPKRVVFLGTKAFEYLDKYGKDSADIEILHCQVVDNKNVSFEVGLIDGLPAVSVNHPRSWGSGGKGFIPLFLYLHKCYARTDDNRRYSAKDLAQTLKNMRNNLRCLLNDIQINSEN